MKPVRLLQPAEFEMLEAARFYESQATGLGLEFLDKVDAAIQDIGMNPERWPMLQTNIRRRLILRFPYALLYRIDENEIVVQAVMHLRQRPGYWSGR
jgi:plasmid stabilization system protein ParE